MSNVDSSQPPLRRTFTSVERDTLEKAMDVIKQQEKKYRANGLSSESFFFGVINLWLIGFILGKWPEHYWLFHLVKCFFYFGIIWWTRLQDPREILSLTEICWVACHACMVYLIVLALTAFGISDFSEFILQYGDTAFKMFWGFANGPLAAALVMLNNAMVFHDLQNMASCFIHLTPSTVSWSLRWYKPQLQKAYPTIFQFTDPENKEFESMSDVVLPPILFYFTWFTIYSIFMIGYGRFLGESEQKIKDGQWDTAYAHTLRHVKACASLVGYNPKNHSSLQTFFKYMAIHAFYSVVMICFSYVYWQSFYAHTCYCVFLFMLAAYNGSKRYVDMMTKWYQISLGKLVKEAEDKKTK